MILRLPYPCHRIYYKILSKYVEKCGLFYYNWTVVYYYNNYFRSVRPSFIEKNLVIPLYWLTIFIDYRRNNLTDFVR